MSTYNKSKFLLFDNHLLKNFPVLYRKFATHLKYDEAKDGLAAVDAPNANAEECDDLKTIWTRFDPVAIRSDKKSKPGGK